MEADCGGLGFMGTDWGRWGWIRAEWMDGANYGGLGWGEMGQMWVIGGEWRGWQRMGAYGD